MAIVAVQNPEWIKRLLPYFFLTQKVVTPRLLAKINHRRELFRITNTTNHRYMELVIRIVIMESSDSFFTPFLQIMAY